MLATSRFVAAAFCTAFSLAASAVATDDAWSLVTADLKSQVVAVKSMDAAALNVSGGPADKAIPIDQFVELSRSIPQVNRTGKFDLLLVGGDRINGEPVSLKDDSMVWKNPVVGDLPVPLRLVTGLVKADGRVSLDRRRDDEITLGNGDIVRGTITELSQKQISIKTDAGDTPIPFASMSSIGFATAAGPSAKSKPTFRIQLDEGSSVVATSVKMADGKLLATADAVTTLSIDLVHVSLVEQVNGPVAFLSGRQPSANIYTPYLGSDQRFLARFNTDFDGNIIRFREKTYPRSIAAHSYSSISWPLNGGYVAFRTRFAMDPKAADGAGGDVTVRVKLDDKVVFEKEGVRPGVLSAPLALDLGEAKSLTLEVDYGRLMDSNDRLNWLEPVLLRVKPADPSPAETQPTK